MSEVRAEELAAEVFQSTDKELDFDGEEGQQLLRILLQMTMSDYAPLTSIALKVLFRHFTQYQELVEDLKQVLYLFDRSHIYYYFRCNCLFQMTTLKTIVKLIAIYLF